MDEKRRDIRYPARIVASVVRRNETLELLTNDVSYRGAFVRTDAPPALRQLLRVTFDLPNGGPKVSAHSMVVRVVTRGEGGEASRVPGIGLLNRTSRAGRKARGSTPPRASMAV